MSAIRRRIGILAALWLALSIHAVSAQRPAQPSTPSQRPPQPSILVPDELQKRGIVGYADRLTAQPGQTVRFMVSSELPRYRADIVRLIHGDANPKGPGFKEVVVDTPANREYPGKHQDLPFGSYVTVPDHQALRLSGSFTFTAWIAPTTPGQSFGVRAAQGVLTKWSEPKQQGYGVFIDEEGRLALWLSDKGGRVEKVHGDRALRAWIPAIPGADRPRPHGVTTFWYFVAASFDASTGRVVLVQQPLNNFPGDPTRSIVERTTALRSIAQHDGPLLMAAYWTSAKAGGHYNGKIDNPRLYDRALTRQEIEAIQQGRGPADAVVNWDFSADIATDRVTDTSPRRLHGQTVNIPMRAVTGHNWDFTEMDFKHARQQYGAIYFHDDDLEDARWDVGFELRLPDNLKSGVYAARLRAGEFEDYVPFFVRPKQGAATAKIAMLIPTFSYLAYAGTNGGGSYRALSLYSTHNDGSGIAYSSRLRPITNMRPKITTNNPWQFMADTHLVDWLEAKGFAFDVITDEDVHVEGLAVLKPYNVVLTGTHPEYTSVQMLDAFQAYMEQGGRMMYMGGNGFYWVTTMDSTRRFIEVRRRDGTEHWQGAPGEAYHATTGEPGGLWRFRGRAPQMLVGVGFTAQGFDRNSPFRRAPGSFDPRAAFIFDGIGADELIGEHASLVLQVGAAGSELDRVDYALGSPPHTLILATSFGHSDAYHHVVEEVNTSNSRQHGTVNPLVKADIAFAEYPNGGAVFSTSSIAWCGSLSFNTYTNNVSRITENVLRRFASDTPIPWPTVTTPTSPQSGAR